MGRLVNQGLWWCGLKDENGRQKHPHCDCENCKDREDEVCSTTYTVAQTITVGENYDSRN